MWTRAIPRAFGAVMVLGAVISVAVTTVHAQLLPSSCPTGIANFGDSFTDTGNEPDAFPFFGTFNADNPPYGESFFGAPAKRFCNGRLVPDFFSQAFRMPLLDPYFSVASFNYKFGINFASSASTAAFNPAANSPFSLTPFQTSQFIRFQNSVNGTQAQFGCWNFNLKLPSLLFQNPFSTWLYTIRAGANDILYPYMNGVPISTIETTFVPQAIKAISLAILILYERGARKFLVSGLAAGGCTPVFLAYGGSQPTDNLGCLVDVNNVIQTFNDQLFTVIRVLRQSAPDISVAYFDYYSAHIAILTNPASFGFTPALTKTACCGAPGNGTSLNYNLAVTCGMPGSNKCENPDQYVIWDGIHFTEAFYRYIAIFALNGVYTDGGPNYAASCNLDFSKFASGVTFPQAYPFQTCNNLFT